MHVLDLFAGIGGLSLGLQRAGMTIVGHVEADPYCRQVLTKHWPEVPCHDDVRTTVQWWRRERRPRVDLLAAGFPCQPVSLAGRGFAQDDDRWLWPATATVIRQLRPRYVLLENVPGLLGRAAGVVLGDLAASGYDAEWDCLPASAYGAPHRRDRWYCLAYPDGSRRRAGQGQLYGVGAARRRAHVADADECGRGRRSRVFGQGRWGQPAHRNWWAVEPDVGRVAHGIPHRVERLRALGNAVVPQVAEHLGRLITHADRDSHDVADAPEVPAR